MRNTPIAALAAAIAVLLLAGCGSSSDSSAAEENEATAATTEAANEASLTASGAAAGSFDTVKTCSTSGGAGDAMFVQLTGSLDGSAATLTLDQDTFTPDVYVYPQSAPPPSDTELRSDVVFDQDTAKGSWQFFAIEPANLRGDMGGSIGIVEKADDTLDFTIDAKYGTTDASGPLSVKGEVTCTAT